MIIKNIFSFILLMLFSFSSFADVGLNQSIGSSSSSQSQTSKWLKDDEVARLIESKQNAISAAFTKSVTVTSNGDVYIDGKKVEENNPSVQQLKSDPALLEQVRQYSWVSQTPPVSMTPNDRISQIVKVVSERFKIQTQNVGRSIAEAVNSS